MTDFVGFEKIARLSREIVVTEKIDGTNAQIFIGDDGEFLVGSRSQWLTPGKQTDNFGFARWAEDHKDELLKLGPGRHFGEWWGAGIQRRYDLTEKRFSLFNTARWSDAGVRPSCCHVVPVLYTGIFSTETIEMCLAQLALGGSQASPGFMKPEGVVIYHTASRTLFKKTIEKDEQYKSKEAS